MHSIGNSKSIYQKMSIKLVHLRLCVCMWQCRGMEHTCSRVKLTITSQQQEDVLCVVTCAAQCGASRDTNCLTSLISERANACRFYF